MWNPEQHGGMKTARFPTDIEADGRIWVPDTTLYEIASHGNGLIDSLPKTYA